MPESDPREIKRRIVEQIYMPVQWELSVRNAVSSGGAFFVESGPGNVLANLVRRIDRSVNAVGAETLISGNP
jgi:[acyl-carrier-protein] S-malonyltransferase